MLVNGRPLLTLVASRTTTGYQLDVQVPEWLALAQREYQYQYGTLAALRQAMERIQNIWLDAELVALGDDRSGQC